MAIEVRSEKLCSPSEAARQVPGEPDPSTITRWIFKGLDGVKLEFVRYGRRVYTSHEALTRFAQALAEVRQAKVVPPARNHRASPSRRQREIARSDAALDAAGF